MIICKKKCPVESFVAPSKGTNPFLVMTRQKNDDFWFSCQFVYCVFFGFHPGWMDIAFMPFEYYYLWYVCVSEWWFVCQTSMHYQTVL